MSGEREIEYRPYPLLRKDREWSAYPIGTKAHAYNGGCWVKNERGWKWNGHLAWSNGGTYPQPGPDACGACVELPRGASHE